MASRRGAKWKVSIVLSSSYKPIKLYTYLINSHALKQYKGFLLENFSEFSDGNVGNYKLRCG